MDFPKRLARRARFKLSKDSTTVEVGTVRAAFNTEQYPSWEAVDSLLDREFGGIRLLLDRVRPTDVLWDVGSNIGLYACTVGQLVASVVAFEPNADIHPTLSINARLNGLNVSVLPIALGAHDTSRGRIRTDRRFGPWERDAIHRTADSMIAAGAPPPDVMKVDVEGAEMEVLLGASRALRDCRMLLVETHAQYGVDVQELVGYLENAGFSVEGVRDDLIAAERGAGS